ncbi:Sybindin-like protein [Neocallimastix sp. 'constans']
MAISSLMIINKAGDLIYQKGFSSSPSKLDSNEYLVLAGTFHGVHTISTRIAPVPSSGIEVIEASNFKLHCFQTQTGTKFIMTTDPEQTRVEIYLKKVYEIYSDYVMKNPFYTPEMPIRCELFDVNVLRYIKSINESA